MGPNSSLMTTRSPHAPHSMGPAHLLPVGAHDHLQGGLVLLQRGPQSCVLPLQLLEVSLFNLREVAVVGPSVHLGQGLSELENEQSRQPPSLDTLPLNTHRPTESIQMHRRTYRRTHGHTDAQTVRHTRTCTHTGTEIHTGMQTHRLTHIETEAHAYTRTYTLPARQC